MLLSKIKFAPQILIAAFLLFILAGTGCANENENKNAGKTGTDNKELKIVCTTSMIGDAVQNVVGDLYSVESLMGAGVDPHLYKPTPSDIKALQNADVIFYNGLYLEAKLEDILKKMAKKKMVVAVGEKIPKENIITISEKGEKSFDPHIWHDVKNWIGVVQVIMQNLSKLDQDNIKVYSENATKFIQILNGLDTSIKEGIQVIPEKQRVLVTSHDAFNYFAKAYDIKVNALQGLSTVGEFGLKDVTKLTDFIAKNKIKAIFVESSTASKPIEAVIEGCKKKGHTVQNGGTLYSDAMGKIGTTEGTYVGMMESNLRTIVNALK